MGKLKQQRAHMRQQKGELRREAARKSSVVVEDVDSDSDDGEEEFLVEGPEDGVEVQQGSEEPSSRRARVLKECLRWTAVMFPGGGQELSERMKGVVERAYKAGERSLGEQDALDMAEGFTIPEASMMADLEMWRRAGGKLEEMRRLKLAPLAAGRMSHERIDKWVGDDNPEKKKLHKLAARGMNLNLEEGFSPNGVRGGPAFSPTYKRMHTAVDKAFYEGFWEKGLAILLPKEEALKIKGLHLCRNSWALKAETPGGRPITDPTLIEKGMKIALNSVFSKLACDEEWGDIRHPSLDDLMGMIVEYFLGQEGVGNPDTGDPATWDDLLIWKMDFKGAFTLLNFSSEATRAMTVEMVGDKVMIFLCGIFGWTGTPACFQVVTRTVLLELSRPGVLKGKLSMFSDDLMGVCWAWDLKHDMDKARKFCWGLMGEGSTKASKDVWGRKLDFIGYEIDLDEMSVGVTERNIYRAIYGFLEVDVERPVTVKLMQRLASWGSRYSKICRFLGPISRVLYREYKGKGFVKGWILSQGGKVAIRMFQALLVALGADIKGYGRNIWTFWAGGLCRVVVEFDASLSGIGLIWYIVDTQGNETPVGVASQSLLRLGFGEMSDYQNTAEYIGALLGLLGLALLGIPWKGVLLRGDSVSALQWVKKGRAKSELAMPAAFAHTRVMVKGQVEMKGQAHERGLDNWRTDGMSRGKNGAWLAERDERFIGVRELDYDFSKWVGICDPRWGEVIESEEGFHRYWGVVDDVLNDFFDEHV